MGNVSFCMKLRPILYPALDLSLTKSIKNCRNSPQAWIDIFILFNAQIENLYSTLTDKLQNDLPCPLGCFSSHQNSDLLETLPFTIKGKKRAYLEEPCSNIKRFSNTSPLFEVSKTCPTRDAVVNINSSRPLDSGVIRILS